MGRFNVQIEENSPDPVSVPIVVDGKSLHGMMSNPREGT
jgi:hypothetical protein